MTGNGWTPDGRHLSTRQRQMLWTLYEFGPYPTSPGWARFGSPSQVLGTLEKLERRMMVEQFAHRTYRITAEGRRVIGVDRQEDHHAPDR